MLWISFWSQARNLWSGKMLGTSLRFINWRLLIFEGLAGSLDFIFDRQFRNSSHWLRAGGPTEPWCQLYPVAYPSHLIPEEFLALILIQNDQWRLSSSLLDKTKSNGCSCEIFGIWPFILTATTLKMLEYISIVTLWTSWTSIAYWSLVNNQNGFYSNLSYITHLYLASQEDTNNSNDHVQTDTIIIAFAKSLWKGCTPLSGHREGLFLGERAIERMDEKLPEWQNTVGQWLHGKWGCSGHRHPLYVFTSCKHKSNIRLFADDCLLYRQIRHKP